MKQLKYYFQILFSKLLLNYVTKLYKQPEVFSNNVISKAVIKYIKYQYKEYANK